jgi:hypothetical protein
MKDAKGHGSEKRKGGDALHMMAGKHGVDAHNGGKMFGLKSALATISAFAAHQKGVNESVPSAYGQNAYAALMAHAERVNFGLQSGFSNADLRGMERDQGGKEYV